MLEKLIFPVIDVSGRDFMSGREDDDDDDEDEDDEQI